MPANSSETARTHMKYGRHGGQAKLKGRGRQAGKATYRDTARTAKDWTRYAATRFGKADYTTYDESGDIVASHDVAYQQVASAADGIAETGNRRDKTAAYIYNVEISPGNGRMTEEQAHRLVSEYAEQLRAAGHRVEGLTYAVHQHSQHTHIHATFASQKVVVKDTDRACKRRLRQVANELTNSREMEAEKAQKQEQRRQAQKEKKREARREQRRQEAENEQAHDWGRGGW